MKIIIKKIYDKLNYIVGSKTAIVRHVIQRKNLKIEMFQLFLKIV